MAETERAFGPVSVLVNHAGVVEFGSMEATEPQMFRRVIDINLYGPWLGMRATAASMRWAGGGAVINVSSTAGLMVFGNLGPDSGSGVAFTRDPATGRPAPTVTTFPTPRVRTSSPVSAMPSPSKSSKTWTLGPSTDCAERRTA
ncbi:hypothetical protein GCM10010271_46530 [Streptomyces kurssanovii]|nr:hypothetical protein GCM10010271_46530 [Streptomyces kurssanovii]